MVAPGDLDAERFTALAEEGRRLLGAERPGAAARTLRDALALWRWPALADVADEPFAQAEARRLEELRLTALEDRAGRWRCWALTGEADRPGCRKYPGGDEDVRRAG